MNGFKYFETIVQKRYTFPSVIRGCIWYSKLNFGSRIRDHFLQSLGIHPESITCKANAFLRAHKTISLNKHIVYAGIFLYIIRKSSLTCFQYSYKLKEKTQQHRKQISKMQPTNFIKCLWGMVGEVWWHIGTLGMRVAVGSGLSGEILFV